MAKPVAKAATKVAVSIPDALYLAVERERRRTGASRSAVVQEALRDWLHRGARAQLVRDYEDGYRARPEGEHETMAALATAASAWSDDEDAW